MASILDSIESSVGVVLGGAINQAQSGITKATAATSSTVNAFIGKGFNSGASVVTSIAPNAAPANPPASATSTVNLAVPSFSTNQIIAAALGLIVVLYLAFRK